jgi:hypothetical protein
MKKRYQNHLSLKVHVFFLIILGLWIAPCFSEDIKDTPIINHHLHNFTAGPEPAYHAVEMGYYFIATGKPSGQDYADLNLIKNRNSHVGPMRLHKKKSTGELFVQYRRLERRGDNFNPLALMYGLQRKNRIFYLISQEDFEILSNYSAARKDISDLTLEGLTFELIKDRFYTSWPTENEQWQAFNLVGNWQSKKVVNDMVAASTVDFPWEKYQAMYFDNFGSHYGLTATNKDYGEQGSYASWSEGKLDYVQRITRYARDINLTGQSTPYAVFANIWDPKAQNPRQSILKWYAEDVIRLDGYLYEKGGYEQEPNGVIPGTAIPAYVDPNNPTGAYLPANKVSLDDVYGFNRDEFDGVDDYDRSEHFNQHLYTCGTAGLYGAWFGWYGEDSVTLLDKDGQLIYTNDLQLLRVIPNWDNLSGIAVPAFNQPSAQDERSWDGEVYQSSNSYVSSDVIYSRSPFNQELYVVFRNLNGFVRLSNSEQVNTAAFVDDWFAKTGEDALSALDIQGDDIYLKDAYQDRLNKGIRITFKSSGDVNDDTRVDIQDIQACVNHILRVQTWAGADVNRDTRVDVRDIQEIVNSILGG